MLQHWKNRGVPSAGTGQAGSSLKLSDGLVEQVHLFVGGRHVVMGFKILCRRALFAFRFDTKLFKDLGKPGINSAA